jgi:hypothetical protein
MFKQRVVETSYTESRQQYARIRGGQLK